MAPFKKPSGILFIILISLITSMNSIVKAQNEVAIGSTTTKSNAILWLNGNGSQGLILPVVTSKSAVSNPDKGMIVYDDSDNKVWYRSNNAWVEVGGGSSNGSNDNLNLNVQGNQLLLRDGTTVLSSVAIATGTQTTDAFMVFQNGAWQFASINDISRSGGNLQVTGIRGKSVATLPATTQGLVYDPGANSGNGGWTFQPLSGASGVTSISGTTPVTVTNPTTTPTISLANGGITNALLADNIVNSAKIQDGTITGIDIANTSITADKLGQSGATNNQILQWNGTNWAPTTPVTSGTVTQVSTGTGLTGGPIITTGTISIAANGVGTTQLADNAVTTTKINAGAVDNTKLADNSINSAKISDGTITGADIAGTTITADKLAASGASNGQVLKWNGTNWVPQADNTGAALPVLAPGQLLTNNGTNDVAVTMSGDATFTGTGALTITNNAVTTTKLADNSVTSAKIVNATVTGADIAATTITGSNIAGTTITTDKLAQSGATNNQVLQWNGTNWVPASQNFLGITLNSTQLFVGNASNVATAVTMSGDATISNTGTLTIANNAITTVKIANSAVDATKLADNAVTTTKINAGAVDNTKLTDNSVTSVKIADGTITSSDLSTLGAVSPGQILQWNGTSWSAVILPATPIDVTTQTGVLVGDGTTITGTNAGAGVRGILGSSNNTIGWVTGTPNQILGTNASGDLQFADQSAFVSSTLNSSQILVGNASNTATAVTMSGDATLSNTGALTIANNAINSAKISDGSITGTDIAATTITGNNIFALTITADKLAQSGATNDQVLQWNGTNWVPTSLVADFSTLNIIPKGNGSGLVASQIFDNGTNMGIGTVTPAAKLDIIGTIKITDGTQAAGSVLTSDANGLASWQPAGAGSGWTLLGNGSTVDGTNFIGTTNNIPFSIRVNNVRSGRIETTTGENTFFGYRSGLVNAGTRNTGMGVNSLDSNDGGSNNTAFGYNAMQANTDGIENTAFGYNALTNNTTANLNTAFGKSALYTQNAAVTNTNNTAVGYHALYFNNPTTTNDGKNNVALGYFAGEANTTGRDNTFIGASAQPSSGTLNNATAIGSGAVVDRSNTMIFGNGTVEGWGFGGAQPASCCDAIIVGTNTNNGNGATLSKFGDWTSTSDGTKKYNINPLEYGLKEIMLLKPVNYQWKGNDEVDFGFIAQEVKTILPEIVHGEEGHMTLSYGRVTAVLTKAIQEQQDQIEALKAQLKDKDDKVLNLESSVNSMKEELETIKRALGMEATAKSSSKNK
jgi:hypothetical protein